MGDPGVVRRVVHGVVKEAGARCGGYEQAPETGMVRAVCTLPAGHEGRHEHQSFSFDDPASVSEVVSHYAIGPRRSTADEALSDARLLGDLVVLSARRMCFFVMSTEDARLLIETLDSSTDEGPPAARVWSSPKLDELKRTLGEQARAQGLDS